MQEKFLNGKVFYVGSLFFIYVFIIYSYYLLSLLINFLIYLFIMMVVCSWFLYY